MRVAVKYLGQFSEIVGRKEELVEFEGREVVLLKELISKLVSRYESRFRNTLLDENGNIRPYMIVSAQISGTIGCRRVEVLEGLETKLSNGSTVVISTPAIGG